MSTITFTARVALLLTLAATSAAAAVDEVVASAGGSGLTYDAAADEYTYVWKTDRAWKGSCRQLVVTLTDGTDHCAYFQFK